MSGKLDGNRNNRVTCFITKTIDMISRSYFLFLLIFL